MFSSVDLNNFPDKVSPSSEQISSITACSDGDCHSYKDHLEGGQAFSLSSLQGFKSTSGNNILQHHISLGITPKTNVEFSKFEVFLCPIIQFNLFCHVIVYSRRISQETVIISDTTKFLPHLPISCHS